MYVFVILLNLTVFTGPTGDREGGQAAVSSEPSDDL